MILRVDDLVLDDARVCVEFSGILGEENYRRLSNVKCRTTPALQARAISMMDWINSGVQRRAPHTSFAVVQLGARKLST